MVQDMPNERSAPHTSEFKLKFEDDSTSFTEKHRRIYNTALRLFSLLTYAYLLLFPILSIVLGWLIWQQSQQLDSYLDKIIFASEITAFIISTRVSYYFFTLRFPLPNDIYLPKDAAAYFYTLVNEVQLESHAPSIQRICISSHYESKLIRTPSSGYAFKFTNTLILGLPLIQSLSVQQLKAVIKRELLHIIEPKQHISGWFYNLRNIWPQYQQLPQKSWSINFLFIQLFFSWYAPLYKLLSQAAARHEELYVDKQLYQQNHHDSLVDILTTMGISQTFFNEVHFPHLMNKAYKHEIPPYFPYESFERNLHTKIDSEFCQHWLDKTLNQEGIQKDFPSFPQRIQNIGLDKIWLPDMNTASSASSLLDDMLFILCQQMDDEWFKNNEDEWNSRYKIGQLEQNKLKEYQVLLKQNILSDQKTWEYILLTKKYVDELEASELYKQILKTDFSDPRISFEIGRKLLKQLDEDGIDAMHKTIKLDDSYTVMACQLLTKYYSQLGDKKMAQSYRRRALEYQVEAA